MTESSAIPTAPTAPGEADPIRDLEIFGASDAHDDLSAATVAALHGLLDAAGPPPGPGEPLPPLWHWLAFRPQVPQRDLGPDGHPRVGLVDSAQRPLRRMWASGTLSFGRPLAVGARLRRLSRTVSVEYKTGRSGEIIFVTGEHHLQDPGSGDVREVQVLAYRSAAPAADAAPAASLGPPSGPAAGQWPWQQEMAIDPALLFRFSALTYNAHRIHYDRQYATEVEGYPGLVVQGPLQAVLLAELCRRRAPDRVLESFSFRALAPAFDDGPLTLRARPITNTASSSDWELQTLTHRGQLSLSATVRFA